MAEPSVAAPAKAGPKAESDLMPEVAAAVRRWRNKRGSLIMMLHDIQDQRGHVPREAALQLARAVGVPLARIYEVVTFYHYFKLEPPGKAVISVCTGTACYLKGAMAVVEEFARELGVDVGMSTPDRLFHLQCVRCVGCCGLAPVAMVNGKTYGKLTPADVKKIIHEWRTTFAGAEPPAPAATA